MEATSFPRCVVYITYLVVCIIDLYINFVIDTVIIVLISSSVVDWIHSLIMKTSSTTYLFLCPVVIPLTHLSTSPHALRLSPMLLWPTKLVKYTLRYNVSVTRVMFMCMNLPVHMYLMQTIIFDFSSPHSCQGCVSQLELFYQYIFNVVGWFYTSWGILLVCHLNQLNIHIAISLYLINKVKSG